MLIKDKNKWCWCDRYGRAGYPQCYKSQAIADYIDYMEKNRTPVKDTDTVFIGNPYYYLPTIDPERVIWNITDYEVDDEIQEWSDGYLDNVKYEHAEELGALLTEVFRAWEKRHGYDNQAYVVLESEEIAIKDYVR